MIDKILDAREKRYNEIVSLYNVYKCTILCGKINYPGSDKNTRESQNAFSALVKSLEAEFQSGVTLKKHLTGFDGSSILMVLDMEPGEAKGRAVKIEENHYLGRIFDIDIYIDGQSIGREDINKMPRRCLICGDNARVCMKLSRHSFEDIIHEANKLIDGYGEKDEN